MLRRARSTRFCRLRPWRDRLGPMSRKLILFLLCAPVWAQSPDKAKLEKQADALRALVGKTPKLPLEKTEFKVRAAGEGWELGYPSAVAMSKTGLMYVLQRGEKADPILAVDRDGHIVRSWGKGMFTIPHSIRIDPAGNIWTVERQVPRSTSSSERRETARDRGGGQPATGSAFNRRHGRRFWTERSHLHIGRVWECTSSRIFIRRQTRSGVGNLRNGSRSVSSAARHRNRRRNHLRCGPGKRASAAVRSRRTIPWRMARTRQSVRRHCQPRTVVDRHSATKRTQRRSWLADGVGQTYRESSRLC